MADHLSVARELLRQLLTAGPQKGSRLKVVLAREFERRTATNFQAAFWNFPKFSAFLAANVDLVEVTTPGGPGDLSVRLRHQDQPPIPPSQPTSPGLFLPKPVWSAFTNPDPRRRRFLHRISGEIAHYLQGSQEAPNPTIAAQVASDSTSYVEIVPITAEQQAAWLRDFLAAVQVQESKRSVLENLAAMPYSSTINTAFMATLGDLAESWRQFRAARVHEAVRLWAEGKSVAFDLLRGLASPAGTSTAEQAPAGYLGVAASPTAVSVMDLRRWLHTVVDALDAADLGQILVPAAALLKLNPRRP